MISSSIRIFVDENEFDFPGNEVSAAGDFKLDAETSVSKLKAHFFETLGELGKIQRFSQADTVENGELARELASPDTIVASFHESPPNLPCRLLQHAKGGLMLPGGFLGGWTFRESTMNVVETVRQKRQLELRFGSTAPALGVFAQRLATDIFRLPDVPTKGAVARKGDDHAPGPHLLYGGRIIPNKGIVQLIRCLSLWPVRGASLTIIGNYEPDFPISQSGGDCATFESYFQREGIGRNRCVKLEVVPPMPQELLVKCFWKADAFLYPSFHEDEASGNAAHEAVLSGIPAIVTDWCGLGQLGRNTRGGAVPTYTSLGGVRYSLHALREQIAGVGADSDRQRTEAAEADAAWVKATFDSRWMQDSVQQSVTGLLERNVGPPPEGGWRCRSRVDLLAEKGPDSFKRALACGPNSDPPGLYVDGLGYHNEWYSEARFLTAIQGLYTTYPEPPGLRPGVRLHGFWRVALWPGERALVEFGFPGPRMLRFNEADWSHVVAAAKVLADGEIEFVLKDEESCRILQRGIDLGYLVPHDLKACRLSHRHGQIENGAAMD